MQQSCHVAKQNAHESSYGRQGLEMFISSFGYNP
jgi:hypothetical protein